MHGIVLAKLSLELIFWLKSEVSKQIFVKICVSGAEI